MKTVVMLVSTRIKVRAGKRGAKTTRDSRFASEREPKKAKMNEAP